MVGSRGSGRVRRAHLLRIGPGMLAGGVLAACGAPAAENAGKGTIAPVTISFSTDWIRAPRSEVMKNALELWAQRHPQITIDRHDITGDYFTAITSFFASGTQDDVILFNSPQFAHYRKLGVFVDLTPLLKSDKIDPAKTYTRIDPVYTEGTKRYAVPFQFGAGVWFVNRSLLREVGVPVPADTWTWVDAAEIARKLTNADKNQFGLGPEQKANPQTSLLPLMISNGAHHIGEGFNETTLTTPAALEAITWVAERITRDRSWVGAGATGVGFASGNQAFEMNGVSNVSNYESLNGKIDWDLIPQPRAPRTGKSIAAFNEQPHIITKKTTGGNRVEAAFTFITFMASRDVQLPIARLRGTVPILRELVSSAPYTNAPPANMGLVARVLETAADMRFFAGYDEWLAAYMKELGEIWAGRSSVESAARKATDAGNAVLTRLGLRK